MLRSLTLLALCTACAGIAVACEKNDASTTVTTGAAYAGDAGVAPVLTPPPDPGARSESSMAARPSDLNAMPPSTPNGNGSGRPGANGANGASIPRAMAPDSPANGTYAPGSAGSMNNGGAMNGGSGGAGVGAVNDGPSAGSMNGTRPMNQPGSSASPYRPSNGATDAPHAARPQPNGLP